LYDVPVYEMYINTIDWDTELNYYVKFTNVVINIQSLECALLHYIKYKQVKFSFCILFMYKDNISVNIFTITLMQHKTSFNIWYTTE